MAPLARLVAPAPPAPWPCAAARQKQARVRQPAAQPPQAWEKPPAYELHEDAKTCQVIGGVELDQLIGSCVLPDQVIRDWPPAVRVVKAFEMDGNEGSMQSFGWDWYRGKVCKKYKCFKDDSGEAYVWVRFDGDPYDVVCAPSRSSVAATPSSCAKCRLPAAPPDQPASASKCEGTLAVESHSILVLVCVGAGCCGCCVCGSCCVCAVTLLRPA